MFSLQVLNLLSNNIMMIAPGAFDDLDLLWALNLNGSPCGCACARDAGLPDSVSCFDGEWSGSVYDDYSYSYST